MIRQFFSSNVTYIFRFLIAKYLFLPDWIFLFLIMVLFTLLYFIPTWDILPCLSCCSIFKIEFRLYMFPLVYTNSYILNKLIGNFHIWLYGIAFAYYWRQYGDPELLKSDSFRLYWNTFRNMVVVSLFSLTIDVIPSVLVRNPKFVFSKSIYELLTAIYYWCLYLDSCLNGK